MNTFLHALYSRQRYDTTFHTRLLHCQTRKFIHYILIARALVFCKTPLDEPDQLN